MTTMYVLLVNYLRPLEEVQPLFPRPPRVFAAVLRERRVYRLRHARGRRADCRQNPRRPRGGGRDYRRGPVYRAGHGDIRGDAVPPALDGGGAGVVERRLTHPGSRPTFPEREGTLYKASWAYRERRSALVALGCKQFLPFQGRWARARMGRYKSLMKPKIASISPGAVSWAKSG